MNGDSSTGRGGGGLGPAPEPVGSRGVYASVTAELVRVRGAVDKYISVSN